MFGTHILKAPWILAIVNVVGCGRVVTLTTLDKLKLASGKVADLRVNDQVQKYTAVIKSFERRGGQGGDLDRSLDLVRTASGQVASLPTSHISPYHERMFNGPMLSSHPSLLTLTPPCFFRYINELEEAMARKRGPKFGAGL